LLYGARMKNQLTKGENKRVMYVENKDGYIDDYSAHIGWVTFSKTGKTVYYLADLQAEVFLAIISMKKLERNTGFRALKNVVQMRIGLHLQKSKLMKMQEKNMSASSTDKTLKQCLQSTA